MKRVVFASVLMLILLAFNVFCLFTIGRIKNEATEKLDSLYEVAASGNSGKIAEECEKFTGDWLSEHHVLCLIVRHDLLDQVTIAVSRFVPLAEYGETGELSAEILRSKILIEEIWDSERPLLRNIF